LADLRGQRKKSTDSGDNHGYTDDPRNAELLTRIDRTDTDLKFFDNFGEAEANKALKDTKITPYFKRVQGQIE
jgi:hypothetical protein